jgi:hypothetical protein
VLNGLFHFLGKKNSEFFAAGLGDAALAEGGSGSLRD